MNADAAAAVPPTREFTAAWAAYFFFAVGWLFWWPALIGLVLCYVKRGDAQTGFIDSHYDWLIRTFWISLAGYAIALAVIALGVWPILRDVITAAMRGQEWGAGASVQIDWSAILSTVGGALIGAIGIVVVWLWYLYRLLRGALRLQVAREVP